MSVAALRWIIAGTMTVGCGADSRSTSSQMLSCAQTFADRFISASGLDAALPWLFGIYASCMDARVDLLGVEYALWGLVVFAVCAALALAALRRSA